MKSHQQCKIVSRVALILTACTCSIVHAVDYDDFPPDLQELLDLRIADLNANGGVCVAGRVAFSDGKPISGGEDVQVNLYDGIDEPHWMYAGGWFIMRRTLSSYYANDNRNYVVRAFGYDPIDAPHTLLEGEMTYLDFVMLPTPVGLLGSVEGVVTDEDDQPFLGAKVSIKFPLANFGYTSNAYSYPHMEATTTSTGEFSFSGLSQSDHSLIASASGYAFHYDRFAPPVGGVAVQDRRLYPDRRISIEYVHQTDGSRNFFGGSLNSGVINWLNGSGGVDFDDGVVEGYDWPDLRDLELRQDQDILMFRIFYANGRNGFYDAGGIDFASLLEADKSGYTLTKRPCIVGHVYVVRTYQEDQYVKFLVKSDESSFRTIVPGNPAPIAFLGYGLTLDFAFSSGYSQLFVEKHFASPAVLGDDALPYYLDLSGMSGTSFVADLILSYDEADVMDRRLVEDNLVLLQSLNEGVSWSELDMTLDTNANTLSVEGLTSLGWFAIGDLSERQPGDLDRDGDVDLFDTLRFQRCFSGPNIRQTNSDCVAALLDSDVDVDQSDYGLFHRCMSAPDVLADPACAD